MNPMNSELIFICYNRKESVYASVLSKVLLSENMGKWIDQEDLIPGDLWTEEIERVIQYATVALVLIGAHEIGPYQHNEIQCLRERSQKQIRFIPVILPGFPDGQDLPRDVDEFNTLDLKEDFCHCFGFLKLSYNGFKRLRRAILKRHPELASMHERDSMIRSKQPEDEPVILFLKRISRPESSIVSSILLHALSNADKRLLSDNPKLDESVVEDLSNAEEYLASAVEFQNASDALNAFVVGGGFLGSVMEPLAESEDIAWRASTEILAEAKFRLTVTPQEQSDVVRLFFEPRLYFEDDDFLVKLRGFGVENLADD